MAKELPYFKFEPNQYLTGDITLCSFEAQGVFIHLCSFYWSRECSISLAIAKQRYKQCLPSLEELIDLEVIHIDENDQIVIDFLDEQMKNFLDISNRRANAGRKGGKSKAIAKQNEASANIEEKRREDKKREEKKKVDNILMSEAKASDLTEKNQPYFKLASAFYQLFLHTSKELDVDWLHLKKCSAEDFTNHVRLMIEVDGRKEEEIIIVGNFLKKDDFWRQNIQSSKKLREKFDQLVTKAKNKNETGVSKMARHFANDPNWKNL